MKSAETSRIADLVESMTQVEAAEALVEILQHLSLGEMEEALRAAPEHVRDSLVGILDYLAEQEDEEEKLVDPLLAAVDAGRGETGQATLGATTTEERPKNLAEYTEKLSESERFALALAIHRRKAEDEPMVEALFRAFAEDRQRRSGE